MNTRQKCRPIVLTALLMLTATFFPPDKSPAPVMPGDSAPKTTAAADKNAAPASNPGVAAVPPGLTATNRVAGNPTTPTFSWFQTHPFKAAISNSVYAWTMEDGRDTNTILHLAHNQSEYQRMVTENDTIYRRQLVYFARSFAAQAQQAMSAGQSLGQITLPGLDGQELTVEVTRTDFREGGHRGQIYGKLPGRPGSMVTVAFANSREAFTIISPQDRIYLQAEAREPGEVVVKSINPATYGILWPRK